MKIARLLTAAAVVAGALAVATPAEAHPLDVIVVENGAPCPATFGEIAQLADTTICLHVMTLVPDYKIVLDGKPCNDSYGDDYTEYSVLNYVRVCLHWDHV